MAAAVGGSSLLSGIFGKSAAGQAASAQRQAAALQQQMYQTTRGDLSPFVQAGRGALPQLSALTSGDPAIMQASLAGTPGYQFMLGQGLKAQQAGAAARGLGVSGASLKGAASYATGLADQTFENRFQDALKTAQMGASAAGNTGQIGASLAGTAGNLLSQAGVTQAAGTMALPNAVTGGINSYLGYQAYNALTHPTTGGYQGVDMTGAQPIWNPNNPVGTSHL
jgi:hypothetical protein